jgi:flagellar assembly factor FliW
MARTGAALPNPVETQVTSPDVQAGLARNAIAFPDGIPGFEACRRFVLLSADSLAPLRRLEAIEGPPAAFLGIDPRLVMDSYRCRLSENDMRALGADADSTLLWFAIISEADGVLSANLRAPIVINPQSMIGRQVLPDDGLYPIRHVLATGKA